LIFSQRLEKLANLEKSIRESINRNQSNKAEDFNWRSDMGRNFQQEFDNKIKIKIKIKIK
jgi:hypothetical protein